MKASTYILIYGRGSSRKGEGDPSANADLRHRVRDWLRAGFGHALCDIAPPGVSGRRRLGGAHQENDALISALLKISENPGVPHVPSEVRQMFIENPPSGSDLAGLFATHPPIAARIRVLKRLGGTVPDTKGRTR